MNHDQEIQAERLAELKLSIKAMEDEVKELQEELIQSGAPDKIVTEFGKLTKASRVYWEPIDNDEYITLYTVQAFIKAATITVSGVKKAFGDAGVRTLEKHGLKREKSTSVYYSLRK